MTGIVSFDWGTCETCRYRRNFRMITAEHYKGGERGEVGIGHSEAWGSEAKGDVKMRTAVNP